MVTLQDVADAGGVSLATVSRILNGERKYTRGKPAARAQHIRELAARMGYRANAAASQMAKGRSGIVGLIVPDHQTPPRGLLEGLSQQLTTTSTVLAVATVEGESLSPSGEEIPILLRQRLAESLLVLELQPLPPGVLRAIESLDTPVVWLCRRAGSSCVYVDERNAAERATRHLLELGHTRIGLIDEDWPRETVVSQHAMRDRLTGYRHMMIQQQCPPMVLQRDSAKQELPQMLSLWLQRPDRPTALLAPSRAAARAALLAAAQRKLSIPEELSIICFDDAPDDQAPQFSAMCADGWRIGKAAAEMASDPKARSEAVAIAARWRPGATCAAAPVTLKVTAA